MATIETTSNDIIDAWQSLIEKSVKANTTFLQESAKIFTDILSKKIEAKDLLKINTEVLNAAANNLIKLNISTTENLVNFGINLSKSFFSFTGTKNSGDGNENNIQRETITPTERSQINLSALQGQSLSTSFYLNSHNAFSQSGKFYFEDFVNESTGRKANISMSILPEEFILEPGKSLKVDISLNVKEDVQPGKFQSTVRLDGMDNQEFDIILEIREKKQGAQEPKPSAATKKPPVKKPANKKIPVKKTRTTDSKKK